MSESRHQNREFEYHLPNEVYNSALFQGVREMGGKAERLILTPKGLGTIIENGNLVFETVTVPENDVSGFSKTKPSRLKVHPLDLDQVTNGTISGLAHSKRIHENGRIKSYTTTIQNFGGNKVVFRVELPEDFVFEKLPDNLMSNEELAQLAYEKILESLQSDVADKKIPENVKALLDKNVFEKIERGDDITKEESFKFFEALGEYVLYLKDNNTL